MTMACVSTPPQTPTKQAPAPVVESIEEPDSTVTREALDKAALAMETHRPTDAIDLLLHVVCPDRTAVTTAADLKECPLPTSPDVSTAWVMLGTLAYEGDWESRFKRPPVTLQPSVSHGPITPPNGGVVYTFEGIDVEGRGPSPDALAIAEVAFTNANTITPSRYDAFVVLYKLATTQFRRDHFAESIVTYAKLTDSSVWAEARRMIAMAIASPDWDGDGKDDPHQDFDRPDLQTMIPSRVLAGVYAEVVGVEVDQALCGRAQNVLDALRHAFPRYARLAALQKSVDACP
jgi:hypothetical protein